MGSRLRPPGLGNVLEVDLLRTAYAFSFMLLTMGLADLATLSLW